MGLDFGADKPRMNAEWRIMMAELLLKLLPSDIFIPANGDEKSHVNEKWNHPC